MAATAEIDARPGGRIRWTHANGDSCSGQFVELVPARRIVYNEFYRRDQSTLTASGGRTLRPGDVCLLGDDVIHGVTNPSRQHAGAIHVYGGDLFATPRSEWRGDPLTEEPNDPARTIALFEAANTTTAS